MHPSRKGDGEPQVLDDLLARELHDLDRLQSRHECVRLPEFCVLTVELPTFVRSSLPAPPGRVLESGAGERELAWALDVAGYEVTAIHPRADAGGPVHPMVSPERAVSVQV